MVNPKWDVDRVGHYHAQQKQIQSIIPSPLGHVFFFISGDIWQIRNGTSIESAIITRNKNNFYKYLLRFVGAMVLILFSFFPAVIFWFFF